MLDRGFCAHGDEIEDSILEDNLHAWAVDPLIEDVVAELIPPAAAAFMTLDGKVAALTAILGLVPRLEPVGSEQETVPEEVTSSQVGSIPATDPELESSRAAGGEISTVHVIEDTEVLEIMVDDGTGRELGMDDSEAMQVVGNPPRGSNRPFRYPPDGSPQLCLPLELKPPRSSPDFLSPSQVQRTSLPSPPEYLEDVRREREEEARNRRGKRKRRKPNPRRHFTMDDYYTNHEPGV